MAEAKKTIKKTVSKVSKKPEVKAVKASTKKAEKAPEPMVSKKAEIKVVTPKKTVASKEAGVNVKAPVVGVDGASKGTMSLPSEIFGAKPNKNLVAQAIRVYLANQRQGTASTKTRGEVTGSTRKIYRQKGTGRARHGALKAPIFVGGGVAMGPRPHDFSLDMPQKMRKAALICALSEKAQGGMVKVIDGEFSGKTKEVARLMKSLEVTKKGKADKVLFVVDKNDNAKKGAHNLFGLEIEDASTLSTYGVAVNRNVIFLKSAVEKLKERLIKN